MLDAAAARMMMVARIQLTPSALLVPARHRMCQDSVSSQDETLDPLGNGAWELAMAHDEIYGLGQKF